MLRVKLTSWTLSAVVATSLLAGCGSQTGDPADPSPPPAADAGTPNAGGEVGASSGDGAAAEGAAAAGGESGAAGGANAAADDASLVTAIPAGDPADLRAALAGLPETQRIAASFIRPLCGKSSTCLVELDAVEAYARDDCARDSTCPAVVAGFVESPAAGLAAGSDLPDTFPTVAQVRDVLWKATYDEARSEGGQVAPTTTAPAEGTPPTGADSTPQP